MTYDVTQWPIHVASSYFLVLVWFSGQAKRRERNQKKLLFLQTEEHWPSLWLIYLFISYFILFPTVGLHVVIKLVL